MSASATILTPRRHRGVPLSAININDLPVHSVHSTRVVDPTKEIHAVSLSVAAVVPEGMVAYAEVDRVLGHAAAAREKRLGFGKYEEFIKTSRIGTSHVTKPELDFLDLHGTFASYIKEFRKQGKKRFVSTKLQTDLLEAIEIAERAYYVAFLNFGAVTLQHLFGKLNEAKRQATVDKFHDSIRALDAFLSEVWQLKDMDKVFASFKRTEKIFDVFSDAMLMQCIVE